MVISLWSTYTEETAVLCPANRPAYWPCIRPTLSMSNCIGDGESVVNSCHLGRTRPAVCRSRPDRWTVDDLHNAYFTCRGAEPGNAWPWSPAGLLAARQLGWPAGRLVWWEEARNGDGREEDEEEDGETEAGQPFAHRRIDMGRKSLRSRNRCWLAHREEERWPSYTDRHLSLTSTVTV